MGMTGGNRYRLQHDDDRGKVLSVIGRGAGIWRRYTLFLVSCPNVFRMYLICACLSLAGCDNGNQGSKTELAEFLDLVVEKGDNADKEGVISLRAVLKNKSSREVEVYFTGKMYATYGGFRVYHDTEMLVPRFKLRSTTEYSVLPRFYGLLPAHGQREFDLLLELPKDKADAVLADPESARVVLVIPRIRIDGSHAELFAKHAELLGHWKQSSQGTSKPGSHAE